MQCSAVQCSAVQCSAVQCSAVQCSAVQCSRSVILIYLFDILMIIRIHSIYIINTYIPLMNRVNSMVMVEKLKRTLLKELKRTLTQQKIYKKKSTSVGTNNQVESFLVILDSG